MDKMAIIMHNNDMVDHKRDKANKWTTETRINQIGEMKNSLSSVFLRCMLNAMPGFLPWRDFAFFYVIATEWILNFTARKKPCTDINSLQCWQIKKKTDGYKNVAVSMILLIKFISFFLAWILFEFLSPYFYKFYFVLCSIRNRFAK